MKVFKDAIELKKEVEQYINTKNVKIISIDGKDGSGKTFLAKEICKGSNYIHFPLDDKYLIKQKSTYVDNIKNDELKQDIILNLEKNNVLIIDGICILKILDNINISSELKIYVKKLLSFGYWSDSDLFDYSKDVNEVLTKQEKQLRKFLKFKAFMEDRTPPNYEHHESIFHEIIKYHQG